MIAKIVAGAIMGESLVLGAVAYVVYQKKKAKIADSFRTLGLVVDLKQYSSSEGGSTIHPVITFKTQNGQVATFESKFGRSNWKIKKGDRVNLLVNKADPNDSEVVTFMAQWGMPLVLVIASIGSLPFAAILYLFLRH